MAVAYGSHNSVGWTSTDGAARSLTITKPTSLAVGELLVAVLSDHQNATDWDTPSGWTDLGRVNTVDDISIVGFCKVADSGDAAATNFTFTISSGTNGGAGSGICGILYRFTTTTTFSASIILSGTDATMSGTSPRTAQFGVTQQTADAVLIFNVAEDGDLPTYSSYAVTNNNPTWTERVDQSTASGDGHAFASATGPRAAVGATGNGTVALSDTAGGSVAMLICVQETQSVSVSPAVIDATLSIQASTVSAGATVSPAVITATATINAPTVSAPASDWVNVPKS